MQRGLIKVNTAVYFGKWQGLICQGDISVAAGVKITGGDKLLTKLKKLQKLGKHRVTAGFYKEAKYPDGTPVATVAAANNFGTVENGGFIPPRPFFSDAIAENKDKWVEDFAKALKATDMDIVKSMKLVGEEMKADIVEKIDKNDYEAKKYPELAQNSEPLKDTTHMMRSINYKVE